MATTTRLGWDILPANSTRMKNFPWVTGKFRSGDHFTVMDYVARRFNAEVEPIVRAKSWGYNPRPVRGFAGVPSEHSAGIAVDFNAPDHWLGLSGTFTNAQENTIHKILADVSYSVRWGGDYRHANGDPRREIRDPKARLDEMHFELQGGNVLIGRVAGQIRAGKLPEPGAIDIEPAGNRHPLGAVTPAPDRSGPWPEKPLPITSKHTADSDGAWRELMEAVGYRDRDLGKNLQSWLDDLIDPRTGGPYYDIGPYLHDGIMGPVAVKGLQRKLFDTRDEKGNRLYSGASDGDRGPRTVRAEIAYLNLPANRGIKLGDA